MNEKLIAQFAENAFASADRTGRIASLPHRAKERPLRIAAFGGSVTYGYNSESAGNDLVPYPALLCELLPYETELCNFAASGTNAWFGLYLAVREIAAFSPDLVLLEYAVNQPAAKEYVSAYESLTAYLTALPSAPALIHVMCVNESGNSSENLLTHVAVHYAQPVICVRNAMQGIPWEEYAGDAVHPHAQGQKMLAEAVFRVMQSRDADAVSYELPAPCLDRSARTLTICGLLSGDGGLRERIPFLHLLGGADAVILQACADSYTLEAEGDAFLLLFRQSCFEDTDDAILTVDDEPPLRLQANLLTGWGNPFVQRVIPKTKSASHRLALRHTGGSGRFILWGIAAYRIRKEDSI